MWKTNKNITQNMILTKVMNNGFYIFFAVTFDWDLIQQKYDYNLHIEVPQISRRNKGLCKKEN